MSIDKLYMSPLRPLVTTYFISALCCLISCGFVNEAAASNAEQLFSQYHDRIYQIRLIELASGSKSSIGSGFQINADGLVATNFHVIADAVHKPEKYRVEYINHLGKKGALKILSFDVVHDLALLEHSAGFAEYFELHDRPLQKGEKVFSVGNPRDLGMSVVEGIYNGYLEHSFYERILFSGSLNPGMSGGPALNSRGEIIGVNVATSGNQLSFLVPLRELVRLVQQHSQESPQEVSNFERKIEQQLIDNQHKQITELINADWPTTILGKALTAGEMTRFTRCWGGSSDDEKALYEYTYNRCFSESDIFVSSELSTGSINYEFYWFGSDELNTLQFYERFKNSFDGAGPINPRATEEDVGNFKCHQDFVKQTMQQSRLMTWKSVLCARPYKEYDKLYDMVFISATISDYHQGLVSHFAISGVTKELGLRFTKKFMEHIAWK